jgi:hypothetical protein
MMIGIRYYFDRCSVSFTIDEKTAQEAYAGDVAALAAAHVRMGADRYQAREAIPGLLMRWADGRREQVDHKCSIR